MARDNLKSTGRLKLVGKRSGVSGLGSKGKPSYAVLGGKRASHFHHLSIMIGAQLLTRQWTALSLRISSGERIFLRLLTYLACLARFRQTGEDQ